MTNQIMVGRDWRYYRFTVPADARNNWNFTFSQQVGDVNLWLRDTVPPGNATTGTEVRSWSNDSKNQGPYSSSGYDAAGTYTFNTPPLRPGHVYYAGFQAANDATFSFSSATSGGSIGTLPVLDFYTGTINTSVPSGSSVIYRIPVPAEATRMKWTAAHPGSVQVRLEQGTLPGLTSGQHWTSGSSANAAFNMSLTSPNSWPWQSSQSYYLLVTNTSGSPQTLVLTMNGKNAQTEDEDNDGLPDAWELLHGGISTHTQGLQSADGVIDGRNEAQRPGIRHHPLFHLVHDVSKRHAALRIGEGVTAAGSRMAKCAEGRPEMRALLFPVRMDGVHHAAGGESGGDAEDAVGTVDERRGEMREDGGRHELPAYPCAAGSEQCVDFSQTACRTDAAKRGQRGGPCGGLIHFRDGVQTGR